MTRIAAVTSHRCDPETGLDYARNFSKRMLKTQLFIGTFEEKRYVEALDSYRDVIRIKPDEEEFIQNLMDVKKKIDESFIKTPWVGITEPETIGAPAGYCLWVIIPQEVFGEYWFKVKTVEFLQNEIRLKLNIVRPAKNDNSSCGFMDESGQLDISAALNQIQTDFNEKLVYLYRNLLTSSNIKESVKFISILLTTIILGSIEIIKYLMEYMLKLIKELTSVIKVCTPIIISFINLVGSTVYGLYSLIAALWFERRIQPTTPVYYLNSARKSHQKALPYRSNNSSVRITEVE